MWEWGQSISFVVATGSTQNMPICHALNLAWGRTLPRLFLVAKSFIIPPPPQKTCTHSLSLSLSHTSQAVLHSFKEVPGLKDFQQWLGEEIQREAQRGKHEVTNMSLHFSGVGSHARLFEALAAMLSRNALNPADVSILYKHYAEEESPPPAHYLHVPQLLGRCK